MSDIFVPEKENESHFLYCSLSDTQDFGWEWETDEATGIILNILNDEYPHFRLPDDNEMFSAVVELTQEEGGELPLIQQDNLYLYLTTNEYRYHTSYIDEPKDYDVYERHFCIYGDVPNGERPVAVAELTSYSTIYSNADISEVADKISVDAYLALIDEFAQDYEYLCEARYSYSF